MIHIYLLLTTILFTTVSGTNNIELSDNNFASLRGQINLITNNNVIKRLMEISPHNDFNHVMNNKNNNKNILFP
jgi:hypothetical protein